MSSQPLSGRVFPRFSSVKTFFRLPWVPLSEAKGAEVDFDIGLVGIPSDIGVSYRSGARMAPTAIREISSLGRAYSWSVDKDFTQANKVVDVGDCATVPVNLQTTYKEIEKFFSKNVIPCSSEGKKHRRFISVGGDHSITLPILRSLNKIYGKINLIHFDAHLDTYPAAWGEEYHHGSFLRHAIEEDLICANNTIQIGLRGPLVGQGDIGFVEKHNIRHYTMDEIRSTSINNFIKKLPSYDGPTYISFDIDCVDPAYAPGTGTPVPGGLTSFEVQKILQGLKIKNLIGADVVEVCPPYDHSQITSLLTVSVLFEILLLMN